MSIYFQTLLDKLAKLALKRDVSREFVNFLNKAVEFGTMCIAGSAGRSEPPQDEEGGRSCPGSHRER